jgi:hypothetical protein
LLGCAWWTLERIGRPQRVAVRPAATSPGEHTRVPERFATREAVELDGTESKTAGGGEGFMETLMRFYDDERAAPPSPATVWGFVWDEEGAPAVGVRLTLTRDEWGYVSTRVNGPLAEVRDRVRATTTAVDGSYSFDDVGPETVALQLDTTSDGPTRFSATKVALRSGERRRLDFGVPFAWPRVRGALLTRAGSPPADAKVHAHGTSAPRVRAAAEVAPDGSFELRLPPGSYALAAELADSAEFRAPLGELELGAGDVRRTFRLGGTRVTGTVRRLDRGQLLAGTERYQELALRRADDESAPLRHAFVDRDGRFALEAVEPGTYVLDGFPLPVATGVGSLRVDVLPDALELELQVDVRAP